MWYESWGNGFTYMCVCVWRGRYPGPAFLCFSFFFFLFSFIFLFFFSSSPKRQNVEKIKNKIKKKIVCNYFYTFLKFNPKIGTLWGNGIFHFSIQCV